MSYKFLMHTADVKFQASGKTLEDVFIFSADALKETISGKTKIKNLMKKKIEIKSEDLSGLLYKFLEEFLFLLDAESFLFSKIENIKIDEKKFKLSAIIVGDNVRGYKITNDVKAVTYNQMFVKKEKNLWKTQVVLDV